MAGIPRAITKGLVRVFFSSVISHTRSSVGPSLETEHVDIAEIAHDELSHNIFSIKLTEVLPDAWVCPLLGLLLEW